MHNRSLYLFGECANLGGGAGRSPAATQAEAIAQCHQEVTDAEQALASAYRHLHSKQIELDVLIESLEETDMTAQMFLADYRLARSIRAVPADITLYRDALRYSLHERRLIKRKLKINAAATKDTHTRLSECQQLLERAQALVAQLPPIK